MCFHLSSFSAGNNLESYLLPDTNIEDTINVYALTTINATNAIGAYFCFVMLVLYVISGIFLEVKDRRYLKNFLLQKNSLSQTQMTKDAKFGSSSFSNESEKVIYSNPNNSIEDKEIKGLQSKSYNNESEKNENRAFIESQENKLSTENEINQASIENQEENKYFEPKTAYNESLNIKNQVDAIKENKDSDGFSSDRITNNPKTNSQENPEMNSTKYEMIKLHPILSIFYIHDPAKPRIIRITLEFFHTIGNMYFIGLFYRGDKAEATNASDIIAGYSIQDFVIIIYSNLIMISFTAISNLVSKTKEIDIKEPTDVLLAVIKKNNRKKIFGLVLLWTALGYFIWSIVLFALQFPTALSYKWIFNTINSMLLKYFVWSVLKILAKVFVINRLANTFKKRKSGIKYSQIAPLSSSQ